MKEIKIQSTTRKIELYLLSEYGSGDEPMKRSQKFLDSQLERLVEDESLIVSSISENIDHTISPDVQDRIIEELKSSIDNEYIDQQIRYQKLKDLWQGRMTLKEAQFTF